jgi:hypothetical protein
MVQPDPMNGNLTIRVKLPADPRCIFQWEWVCGNRLGKYANVTEAMECGPQETFINCADVSIA